MQWSAATCLGDAPPPMYKHTTTAVGSLLYVFGGVISEGEGSHADIPTTEGSELWILDTETFFWYKPKVTGDIPGPRKAHSTSLVNNALYVFGGGDAENYFGDLYVLDVVTHHWTKAEAKGDVPGPRRAHTATVIGNKIWIFGGGDGQSPLAATFSLDTETLTWTEMKVGPDAVLPDARGYHSACAVDTKIAYFGGSDMEECFSDMIVLDTVSGVWSKKKLPQSKCRYSHTATIVGNWIFFFGGCDGAEYLSELNLLNLETMEWVEASVFGEKPNPRGYHSMTLHDNRLFVMGGTSGEDYNNDLYILDLGCYAWLQMQKPVL